MTKIIEWLKGRSVIILIFIEIVLMILMGLFAKYIPNPNTNIIFELSAYQNVHVMIWIGFGFLMTYLKRYGQSAVGFTFLIGAMLVQVALLFDGIPDIIKTGKFFISIESLLKADMAVATSLISMGVVLGKTTCIQLIFMGIIEVAVYTANKYIGEQCLMAVDSGGSMYIHVFGAYFGLAISYVFGLRDKPKQHVHEKSTYQSDIFAMIGTIFLWVFWPTFNSVSVNYYDQQRAVINTLLAISASCFMAFAVSMLVSNEKKFNMIHIQNSTLAGGVAIGTAAGMMCEPIGALVIGSLAGGLSVIGYKYITPLLQKKLKIHDTCGVHNLHGMPGVLAGICGVILAGIANENTYGESLARIFPARGNLNHSVEDFRTAGHQAGYQLLALILTLTFAIIFGLITGVLLRICGSVTEVQKFDDTLNWELNEDIEQDMPMRSSEIFSTRMSQQISTNQI